MSPRPSGRIERIRVLNDRFRQWPFPPFGDIFITAGIAGLGWKDQVAVLGKVRTFEAFTPDNDPHGEHDFGAFEHGGVRYFWKIDYYDLQRVYLSSDPADPSVTCRILTVMQADEY